MTLDDDIGLKGQEAIAPERVASKGKTTPVSRNLPGNFQATNLVGREWMPLKASGATDLFYGMVETGRPSDTAYTDDEKQPLWRCREDHGAKHFRKLAEIEGDFCEGANLNAFAQVENARKALEAANATGHSIKSSPGNEQRPLAVDKLFDIYRFGLWSTSDKSSDTVPGNPWHGGFMKSGASSSAGDFFHGIAVVFNGDYDSIKVKVPDTNAFFVPPECMTFIVPNAEARTALADLAMANKDSIDLYRLPKVITVEEVPELYGAEK